MRAGDVALRRGDMEAGRAAPGRHLPPLAAAAPPGQERAGTVPPQRHSAPNDGG